MNTLASISTVVTGAGKGIGEAIARRYAREGALVAIADIDLAAATSVRDDIVVAGGRALAVEMDVADRVSVRRGIAAAVAEFGRLDVMVNNAGISQSTTLADTTAQVWERHQKVNGLGTLICMQEAARAMIADGIAGKIINLTSISPKRNNADWVAYAASKAMVSSLIASGSRSLAPHGITVTGIAPGIVETPLWNGVHENPADLDARFVAYRAQIPLGRIAVADDLAGAAVFLASEDANYMTGQIITIDGGITA
ncbi:SDR family NAD(P)-dependent oxidoreductase [Salinibacterium sp. ZJ70]|uniref:SDR family NAD(P)-dependent oxidoreductase n=1 Tax=Salinibacterium sp. ZJ70 TaxID=2708084 RepID=UPI00141F7AE8|nr:SDR family oxidoreductase [Salinibacterium sp. ZJ70]